MTADARDVTGFRGEKILELALTNYDGFPEPLFRPGFLGDKWPAIDFYVELTSVAGSRPYFFAQVKSTRAALGPGSYLSISSVKEDVHRLKQVPGPTYLFGVHEPSHRVFVRAIHAKTSIKPIRRIPLEYELTPTNLAALYDEVRAFWTKAACKPKASRFT